MEVILKEYFIFQLLIVYYNFRNMKTQMCTLYENSVKLGAICHEFIKGGGKYMVQYCLYQ